MKRMFLIDLRIVIKTKDKIPNFLWSTAFLFGFQTFLVSTILFILDLASIN